ncbi:MAG: iron chelate uptake ABC transporter family permease subunit [Streptosporangiales bacterium]|nr:iron chelate uptake ABC transporter family permease subunit [Streptosporangiales bacterium]
MKAGAQTAAPLPGRHLRAAGGRVSVRVRPRTLAVGVVLVVAALATGVVSIRFGDPHVPFRTAFDVFTGRADTASGFIVVHLALPRVAAAWLAGAALGASGAIFQSLTRNPLGSPEVIGFNSGAAAGAILAIIYLPSWQYGIGVVAVASGLLTAAAVYLLAWRRGMRGYRLILVGIATTAILQAVNTYLLARADLLVAKDANIWQYGSLNAKTWSEVGSVAVALAALLPVLAVLSRRLDLLEMGDETAAALGVPAERSRLAFVALGTVLAAVAVGIAGPVAFVALAAPQLARRLTRGTGPHLAPAAAMGALLLVAADFVAQHAIPSTNLPVGLATGALGGAYLCWLLAHEWRSGRMRG